MVCSCHSVRRLSLVSDRALLFQFRVVVRQEDGTDKTVTKHNICVTLKDVRERLSTNETMTLREALFHVINEAFSITEFGRPREVVYDGEFQFYPFLYTCLMVRSLHSQVQRNQKKLLYGRSSIWRDIPNPTNFPFVWTVRMHRFPVRCYFYN
jgi:hypothetical protein